jgi:hypothetical protein
MANENKIIEELVNRCVIHVSPEQREFITHSISGIVPQTVLPSGKENAAISWDKPKTAALCFNRIWTPFEAMAPPEIRFFGGTPHELRIVTYTVLMDWATTLDPETQKGLLALINFSQLVDIQSSSGADSSDIVYFNAQRLIKASIQKEHNLDVPLVYSSTKSKNAEIGSGKHEVILASLSNLEIVDEGKLDWEQVIEFRHDRVIQNKYRHLIHWLDKDMVDKEPSFIEDEIAKRLDDYRWALKKHGIQTVLGSLSTILDNRTLLASAASAAALTWVGQGYLGAASVLGVLSSKCVIEIAKALVNLEDIRRGVNSEIAFIYEAEKKFK